MWAVVAITIAGTVFAAIVVLWMYWLADAMVS